MKVLCASVFDYILRSLRTKVASLFYSLQIQNHFTLYKSKPTTYFCKSGGDRGTDDGVYQREGRGRIRIDMRTGALWNEQKQDRVHRDEGVHAVLSTN